MEKIMPQALAIHKRRSGIAKSVSGFRFKSRSNFISRITLQVISLSSL